MGFRFAAHFLLFFSLWALPALAGSHKGKTPFYPGVGESDDPDLAEVEKSGTIRFRAGSADVSRPPIYWLSCSELKALDTGGDPAEFRVLKRDELPDGIRDSIA